MGAKSPKALGAGLRCWFAPSKVESSKAGGDLVRFSFMQIV